ncbi:unnamed protein product [Schistosoma margrebowiei]|uniref:Uncharacterized protein n=1 Tax=Schistosoma margrebowiei TaxID=48269 RepID=A0A183LVM1_9TREM|nr:unnamed protein product [Schistosoma margrebowiei]
MKSINVVICGWNQITASVIKMLRKHKSVNIIGYWCESSSNQIHADVAGIKVISEPFKDLISNKDIQFLFLCDTPVNQRNLVSIIDCMSKKQFASDTVLQDIPYIVIFPPVSPNYDMDMLEKVRIRVGFAMPLRHLPLSTLLFTHLNYNHKEMKALRNYEFTRLPTHWVLGSIESIHIRLSTVSFVDGSEYSWLSESEDMGGGLLNMFCPGLIDLVYFLSGGLRITSVTSICRIFGKGTSDLSHSIRHISADDYVTIMGELDIPTLSGFRKPVVVIIISSDIPFPKNRMSDLPEAHFYNNHCFKLEIEVSGSSGSFLIDEGKRRISWTPRKAVSSKPGKLNNKLSQLDCENHSHDKRPGNMEESKFEGVYTEDVSVSAIGSNVPRTQVPTMLNVNLDEDGMTEIVHLSLNDSLHDSESVKSAQHCYLSATGEAWINWISGLTKSFSPEWKSFEFLSASPGHWVYIQSVMHAITKSAQLRCWIDVQTGKRI